MCSSFPSGTFDWDKIDKRKATLWFKAMVARDDCHWIYDWIVNQWTQVTAGPGAPLPKARSFAGFTSGKAKRSGSLFLFGGMDQNGNILNDLWEFKLNARSWNELSDTLAGTAPSPRYGMGLISDDNGELFIIAGEGTSSGQLDIYKVPMLRSDTPLPMSKAQFIDVYDGDIVIASDDASNPNPLAGAMILCSPFGSPLFPCSLHMQGTIVGWNITMLCDGKMGCVDITLSFLSLACVERAKDSPTFEISAGAKFTALESQVSGCSSTVSGGLIRASDRAVLVFELATVKHSQSLSDGGAIAMYGSTLRIARSVFTECESSGSGGSIWSRSYNALPLPPVYSLIAIVGSTFIRNKASQNGGALFATDGVLTVESSSFTSNSASGTEGGGAICLSNVDAQVVFDVDHLPGNSVKDNKALSGGGGVLKWLETQPSIDVVCAPGHAGSWNSMCQQCGNGTFKESSGSELCADCHAGSYAQEAGASSCTPCVEGKYLSKTGAKSSDECIACPLDKTSASGSASLKDCIPTRGFELILTQQGVGSDSVACSLGSYKTSLGNETCAACPSGTFSDAPGSTYCKPCPPGKTSYPGTMSVQECFCVPGSYGPNTGSCVACKLGKSSAGGTSACQDCPAGKFSPFLASSSCTECGAGSYQPNTGKTACTQCPKTRTTKMTGQTSYSSCLCEPGTYSSGAECTKCGGGKFTDQIGAESCEDCGAGTYTPHGRATCVDGHPTKQDHPKIALCKMKNPDSQSSTYNKDATSCKELTKFWTHTSASDYYDNEDSYNLAENGDLREWCCKCSSDHEPAGKVQGSKACAFCPSGKYAQGAGNQYCTKCPSGRSSPLGSTGPSSCQGFCQAGTQWNAKEEACQSCPKGTYKPSASGDACLSCDARRQVSGQWVKIKNLSTAQEGSTSLDDCQCAGGYYGGDLPDLSTLNRNSGGDVTYYSSTSSTCEDDTAYEAYECHACAGGKYKSSVGWSDVSGCLPCETGKQGVYDDLPCQDGDEYGALDSFNNQCPGSAYCLNNGNEDSCKVETACPYDYDNKCCLCEKNKKKGGIRLKGSLTAQTSCELCPKGKFSNDVVGTVTCKSMDAGNTAVAAVDTCGDGVVTGAEECDDGNTYGQDGCSACCRIEEQDENGGYIYPSQTSLSGCGDGVKAGAEQCDDGCEMFLASGCTSSDNGDGCSQCCTVEKGWDCSDPNGYCLDDESCVDGGMCMDSDTSASYSQLSAGFCTKKADGSQASSCQDLLDALSSQDPAPTQSFLQEHCCLCGKATVACKCIPPEDPSDVCGDGQMTSGEGCDLGSMNGERDSGCSKCCMVSPGYKCWRDEMAYCGACDPTVSTCGDGAPDGCENCDDANTQDGDGCSSECTIEKGYECVDSSDCVSMKFKAGYTPPPSTYCLTGDDYSSSCESCPAGTYSDFLSSTSNVCCGPGKGVPDAISGVVGAPCRPCAAGTYQQAAGQSACTQCPTDLTSPAGSTSAAACYRVCPEGKYAASATLCQACEDGKSVPAGSVYEANKDMASDCACAPGFFLSAGECVMCAMGKYKATVGGEACIECPTGSSTAGAGSSTDSACVCAAGLGGLGSGEGLNCVACEVGMFKTSHGSGNCARCAPGSFANTTGSVTCTLCEKGKFEQSKGMTTCQECLAGSFADSTGRTVCVLCAAGTYASSGDATGQTSSSVCTECAAGKYSDAGLGVIVDSVCKDCDAGHYSYAGSTGCTSCQSGKYAIDASNPGASAWHCANCQTGKYSTARSAVSSAVCSDCGAGTFSFRVGMTACIDCPQGTWANAGSATGQVENTCQQCPEGKYSVAVAATTQDVCVLCPASGHSYPGSSSILNCTGVCGPGQFAMNLASRSCQACPKGSYKNGTSHLSDFNCTSCPSGTYGTHAAQTECAVCPVGSYLSVTEATTCVQCAQGKYSGAGAKTECTSCHARASSPPGSSSDLCSCNIGYKGDGVSSCDACSFYESSCPCKPGFWGDNFLWGWWGGCFLCPENSSPKAPPSQDQTYLTDMCSCNAGYYLGGMMMEDCVVCPSNSMYLPPGQEVQSAMYEVNKWCSCNAGYVMTEEFDWYTYTSTFQCEACPEFSTSPPGSTGYTWEVCKCEFGYKMNMFEECQICSDADITGDSCKCNGYTFLDSASGGGDTAATGGDGTTTTTTTTTGGDGTATTTTGGGTTSCTADTDCSSGEYCDYGTSVCTTSGGTTSCTADTDCSSGEYCDFGTSFCTSYRRRLATTS